MSLPLNNYYIHTLHRPYLIKKPNHSYACSLKAFKRAVINSGCRAVSLEVWDDEKRNNPIICLGGDLYYGSIELAVIVQVLNEEVFSHNNKFPFFVHLICYC